MNTSLVETSRTNTTAGLEKQYSLGRILGIWTLASLPGALLYWLGLPLLDRYTETHVGYLVLMEDVLEVYKLSYNPRRPLICMDEMPKQLLADKRDPLPAQAGLRVKTQWRCRPVHAIRASGGQALCGGHRETQKSGMGYRDETSF